MKPNKLLKSAEPRSTSLETISLHCASAVLTGLFTNAITPTISPSSSESSAAPTALLSTLPNVPGDEGPKAPTAPKRAQALPGVVALDATPTVSQSELRRLCFVDRLDQKAPTAAKKAIYLFLKHQQTLLHQEKDDVVSCGESYARAQAMRRAATPEEKRPFEELAAEDRVQYQN